MLGISIKMLLFKNKFIISIQIGYKIFMIG